MILDFTRTTYVDDSAALLMERVISTAEDARAGAIRMSGNPIKFSAFEDPARRGNVPGLDEHRESILRELRAREATG